MNIWIAVRIMDFFDGPALDSVYADIFRSEEAAEEFMERQGYRWEPGFGVNGWRRGAADSPNAVGRIGVAHLEGL
jgi:hypothetical protein